MAVSMFFELFVFAVFSYEIDEKPIYYDRCDRMAAWKRVTALFYKMERLIGSCPQKICFIGLYMHRPARAEADTELRI